VIIVGIDPHKKSHTAVAVDAAMGTVRGELQVQADKAGHRRLLAWAEELDYERRFALEDCRHVSGQVERFLLAAGEEVVRVSPNLMGATRRGARTYGKSDPIDARAVAEAARREPDLPRACLAQTEDDLRLLVDHHDHLVGERTRIQNRLRWHLHDLGLEASIPPKALRNACRLDRLSRELASLSSVRVDIARQLLEHCRTLTLEIDDLEREIAHMATDVAPELLALPGCGALSAARLVGDTGGVSRFRNEAAFAMHVGAAPVPASSGNRTRYRLNRRGNRRLNATLHRIAVTQLRICESARAFIARKQQEGKSKREALRCLKRHLARRVFGLLQLVDRRLRRRVNDIHSQSTPIVVMALT